jgi:aminoglycoside phosphotransferase (APT) family kinase protein
MTEIPLAGSMDPRYAPVRIGDTVHRDPGESRHSVRALLRHLEATGFDGAPRFVGVDEEDREVVTWIEGDVPLPPYPAWSMTDRALADLGALLRRLHDATASMRGRAAGDGAADWARDWADPSPIGPDHVICHNDPYPENVVFREGRVVALIDFAMAAPGRRLWDLAIAAEVWCPLGDPAHRDANLADLDPIVRVAALTGGYGLERERSAELVDVIVEERAHSVANIRAEVVAGNPAWIDAWAASGGDGRVAADDAWIAANRGQLVRAARGMG